MPSRVRRWLLPWALALGVLLNLAYPMYVHFDFSHSPDTRSYLHMAAGRFDSTRITHRYRVLVPAAAAIVAAPVAKVYSRVWPQRPAGLWPLRFAFYLVNCLLLAAAGATWFWAARNAGTSAGAAAVALLVALSSRWAEYAAGLPLTDSLYLLVFGLSYYAVRRGPAGGWALAMAFLLGPLAKESFFLLVPWLLWFGRKALPWHRQVLALAGGLLALAAIHYWVDNQIGTASTETVTNALDHFNNLLLSVRRAASPKGVGELVSIFGIFIFGPMVAFWLEKRQPLQSIAPWYAPLGWAEGWLLVVVAAHMLLSSDLGRMGYLAAPIFVTVFALALPRLVQRLTPPPAPPLGGREG